MKAESSSAPLTCVMSARLLDWYDLQARVLPWRVPPLHSKAGHRPDPYKVWLSEVMLQQTTVATVGPYFQAFVARWPTVDDLAAAALDEVMAAWAGLGYYSRARNLHACAQAVSAHHGGNFPTTAAALQQLPGIGPYTAAAIAALAFEEPVAVVDGNIERVLTRLHASPVPVADNRAQIRQWARRLTPKTRPGDYAQALMDLGAMVCRPKAPSCPKCPLKTLCAAYAEGLADRLPTPKAKAAKPIRFGQAYLIENASGALLIDKRPPKGLLGGMDGLPTSPWQGQVADPVHGSTPLGLEVRHTFTHFHLKLQLYDAPESIAPQFPSARFVADLATLALPTLFIKALKAANRLP